MTAQEAQVEGGPALPELPRPPYVAVIFTSIRTAEDDEGYALAAAAMERLAAEQPGYLGITSVRDPNTRLGVTVSYWATDDDARAWKQVTEHREVQRLGRTRWYDRYLVEIAQVDRVYGSTDPGAAAG